MKLDSKTASFYHSRPSEWLGGRRASKYSFLKLFGLVTQFRKLGSVKLLNGRSLFCIYENIQLMVTNNFASRSLCPYLGWRLIHQLYDVHSGIGIRL